MAIAPQNVFNNKADFKVPLPESRDGSGKSAKGLGGEHEPALGVAQEWQSEAS
jgi:hypothetical protein